MCIIAPLLFMVLIICGGLIYPIWMIIHCATSESLNGKTKALWILVMVFTWSLGAVLYGLFGCEKKSIPWISAIVILCIGLFSIPIFINMFRSAGQMVVADFAKVNQLDTDELSSSELARFKESLETLQAEVKSSNLDQVHKALTFSELFNIYAIDNKITSWEYNKWIEKFDSRDMLDRDAFSAYVRRQRQVSR